MKHTLFFLGWFLVLFFDTGQTLLHEACLSSGPAVEFRYPEVPGIIEKGRINCDACIK